MKTLVIDDDDQIAKLLSRFLKADGHEISIAMNGEEGMRKIETEAFDLVITDILMPEQDGLEVLMWLRSRQPRPKVIAITGGAPRLDQGYLLKLASKLGADKVLAKPFDAADLQGAYREIFGE